MLNSRLDNFAQTDNVANNNFAYTHNFNIVVKNRQGNIFYESFEQQCWIVCYLNTTFFSLPSL